jgi:hypothetical protein
LKGVAERLPGGDAKNSKLSPLPGISIPSDLSSLATESLGTPSSSGEQTTNGHNGLLASNGPSSIRNKTGNPEVGKNGSRQPEAESCQEAEWVEQDEPGVYITLTALPGGARNLKRVRFRYMLSRSDGSFCSYCLTYYALCHIRVECLFGLS